MKKKRTNGVSYAKWGYFFILPFFVSFLLFSLIPLVDTVRYSFFEYYRSGMREIGPNFIGLDNYIELLGTDLPKYAGNTVFLWLAGFVPQILFTLLLAAWLSNKRIKIHGKEFFKIVIYLPNLIMGSAFSMLFYMLFSEAGPINSLMLKMGIIDQPIGFSVKLLIIIMNFLMGFGGTTLLLYSAIIGVDSSILEAAELDGAKYGTIFFKIILPMIRPVFTYTIITAMISGIQMFDIPQILTNGTGGPDRTSLTLVMYLNNHLANKNYGMAGAVSVFMFIASAILSFVVYRLINTAQFGEVKTAIRKGMGE